MVSEIGIGPIGTDIGARMHKSAVKIPQVVINNAFDFFMISPFHF